MSDHEDLRQCAVYGLGVVAALSPDLVKPHAPAAQQRVLAILQHPQVSGGEGGGGLALLPLAMHCTACSGGAGMTC